MYAGLNMYGLMYAELGIASVLALIGASSKVTLIGETGIDLLGGLLYFVLLDKK